MTGKAFTPNPFDEHIGMRIQMRRVMMGMSQKDLAQICGITFQQIQKYECAGNRIAASRLFELGVAMETPVSFFFAGLPGHIEREPRNGHLPKARVCDQGAEDPLARNETLELINLFWRLPNDTNRELVLQLLRTMNAPDKQ